MPTLLDMFTCIFYIFTPIDFIICYHSKKFGMANNVYVSPIYINVVDFVSYTRDIDNECVLALSQSESFCI